MCERPSQSVELTRSSGDTVVQAKTGGKEFSAPPDSFFGGLHAAAVRGATGGYVPTPAVWMGVVPPGNAAQIWWEWRWRPSTGVVPARSGGAISLELTRVFVVPNYVTAAAPWGVFEPSDELTAELQVALRRSL